MNWKTKQPEEKKQAGIELDVKMNRIGRKVIELKKFTRNTVTWQFWMDLITLSEQVNGLESLERMVQGNLLLNLLTGKDAPDSGKVNVGDTIIFGYYSQQGLELKRGQRVIEVVKDYAEVIQLSDGSKVSASQFLNLFQFPPEQQFTYVSKLSGGEKRRLHLLTVLILNPNF